MSKSAEELMAETMQYCTARGSKMFSSGETFPMSEETAKTCIHNVLCWYGHECGNCEDSDNYERKR